LQAALGAMKARVNALKATVARLQEQLAAERKDSGTSSKPPSSDIVKPPKPAPPEGQECRRICGQPGHPLHERVPFPPDRFHAEWNYTISQHDLPEMFNLFCYSS
jgi:uncharacterized protein DUF6444